MSNENIRYFFRDTFGFKYYKSTQDIKNEGFGVVKKQKQTNTHIGMSPKTEDHELNLTFIRKQNQNL